MSGIVFYLDRYAPKLSSVELENNQLIQCIDCLKLEVAMISIEAETESLQRDSSPPVVPVAVAETDLAATPERLNPRLRNEAVFWLLELERRKQALRSRYHVP